MALAAPDFGELSGLSLDERFLNEAGLLWSSGGEEETESARAWPALDAFAPSGGAPLDAPMEDEPAVSALSLRCIDPSHAPHCTRCTPAPPDAAGVELVGDSGRKNGEKKLRALVTRTPEWNLLSERRKLVPLARAAGLDSLAVALEKKQTSALRKAHLLFMARAWRYRSNTWVPRHDRGADRAMAELQRRAVVAAQQPQLPRFAESASAAWGGVFDPSVLAPEAAWLFTQKTLRPLSLRIAGAFAGDRARLAATSSAEHITPAAAAEVRKVADMAPGLLAQLAALHAMLTAAQRMLPPAMAALPAGACLSSPAFAGADAMLRAALDAGVAQLSQVARASSARLTREGLSAGERCWLQEMASSHDATLELLGHIMRVLEAFRAAPMEDFMTVAGSLLELLMVFITSLGSAASSREAWMRDIIAARGDGGSGGARAQLLVCWPVAPSELSHSSAPEAEGH